jgi:hypothetical protein
MHRNYKHGNIRVVTFQRYTHMAASPQYAVQPFRLSILFLMDQNIRFGQSKLSI